MPEYEVEQILDKRITNGKALYKIKWKGYPEDECTWEPEKNLTTCKEILRKYNDHLARTQELGRSQINPKTTATVSKTGSNHKNKDSNKESQRKKARD